MKNKKNMLLGIYATTDKINTNNQGVILIDNGMLMIEGAQVGMLVRPTFDITHETEFKNGTGTSTNPYRMVSRN